ncbi:Aste57867_13029 [Aphanomyces stellatus]|uniref:Aste57867_13029 protein n=1 Tax=Aphanomyces stellatus TaxID=120398 RepID=A0A485KXJ9_9STRA|nr:hypothetical protein As57867_012981 [Aphanomyces stellatus]VFT89874.1 Aste57867_13029 [Aphanomyces stellatus]
MASAAHACLTSADVLHVIQTFQVGVYQDMLPFLTLPHGDHVSEELDTSTALGPWFLVYSTTRLDKLLCLLPHMRPIVLHHAATTGSLPLLQTLHSKFGLDTVDDSFLTVLARHGHITCIQYCLDTCFNDACIDSVLHQAALHSQWPVVECVFRRFPYSYARAFAFVASSGPKDLIELFLPHQNDKAISKAMESAAANGQLQAVQVLHVRDSGSTTITKPSDMQSNVGAKQAMNRAAENGHLDVVQWLHVHRPHGCTTNAMDFAAKNGHLAVVQWLHTHRTEGCTPQAVTMAAKSGHLEMVQWLYCHYAGLVTTEALAQAVEQGHAEIVQFLVETVGLAVDERALVAAAKFGDCSMVQYLGQRRVPNTTSAQVMDIAAANGHLEVVQCLHSLGYAASNRAMDRAALGGHLEMVLWLHANRTDGCTTFAMDSASSGGHLQLIQWLHKHRTEGCTTNAMDNAALNGHLEVVQFLHAHRHEGCTAMAMDGAAIGSHLHVVQFLHHNRHEGCSKRAIEGAIANGHVITVRWLCAHRLSDFNQSRAQVSLPYGNLRMMSFLLNSLPHLVPWNATKMALDGGFLDTVRLLHEHGFQIVSKGKVYASEPLNLFVERHRQYTCPVKS